MSTSNRGETVPIWPMFTGYQGRGVGHITGTPTPPPPPDKPGGPSIWRT